MLRAACVALLAIVLTACGGGGGGESSSPQLPPSPPTVRTAPLHVGYFGLDGDQIRETADHVSFVMTPDWGDEWWATPGYDADRIGQIIAQMQEAKARGVKEAWIMMGFLVFTAQQNAGCPQSRYTVRPDAIPRLRAFRAQLQALDLDSMVTLLYPVDEPELHCLADEPLSQLVSAIKMEWPVYTGVIYGDTRDYPGLRAYDVVGKDKYDAGAGVLQQLPPITALQKHMLVPGGASWLSGNGPDDPAPFYDYAMKHDNVYAIVSFVWFDTTQGKGIRSNGMAPRYRQMACDAQEKC
jgi:hypothetical protein